MDQKRKKNIDANVKSILKNCSVDEIQFLGLLLTDVIQKSEGDIREFNQISIMEMLQDSEEEYFKGDENKFLSEIIWNKEELQYFVSQMQKNIIKQLQSEENIFSDEDIEKLRDFFTLEVLENCNANKKNSQIRKLIIALWCDRIVIFEECPGISKDINELILKLDEVLNKATLIGGLIEILDILQQYLKS